MLICEDSRTYASALRRVLEHGREIEVLGVCPSAEAAIAALPRLRPELVTMDIELPGMSGLDAVGEIMSVLPVPILVLSSYVGAQSGNAAAALAAGALDAVAKDDIDLLDPAGVSAATLRRRVKLLSRARVIRHPRAKLSARKASSRQAMRSAAAIAICASTGGPSALTGILGALPASFPIPILVVQHIAAGFIEGLARWLRTAVSLPVTLVTESLKATPGVWIAPEGAHLVLEPTGRLALDRVTVAGFHRPAADVLLSSLADAAGKDGVGVVLTGIGRDGAQGIEAIRRAGGLTIAQDEETSAVFGMPKAAIEKGAELVLPLEAIAGRLEALKPSERFRA